ncbi:MAG TPA: EamA family transporter [Verrucomicrobiae bacterium]|nr:EamA family transporter [Verrucomicrobiae bacterium]
MLPIVFGVATAICWAVSVLASARSSRIGGAPQTVAGVMIVGAVLALPLALVASPLPPTLRDPAWTVFLSALAGAANVFGLLLTYAAYRIGAVGIIATIGSTEGAIAAVISVLAGQTLAAGSGLVLALVAFGVLLAATSGGNEREDGVVIDRARSLRAAGLATGAAGLFGLGLFTMGHVSATLPAAWVILPGRLVGVVVVAVPLYLTGRLRVPRSVLPLILLVGFVEVVGIATFSIGAANDIAITSVLASMFAPIAAVFAFVLFRERLAPRQILGIALVVIGIATLGILAGA